jgi:glycosyltransferase involved in cell wall biosynthesis
VEVIPYALNLQVYHPVETGEARKILGLPFDKKIILCGAVDLTESPRKGFPHLLNALRLLQARGDLKRHHISLAVFAREMPLLPGLEELPIHFLGTFSRDEDLVQAYAAADLFVAPSIQDNLPNTVLESMACGTPVAAFCLGGFPDMIDHRVTGWLAEPLNDVDLAEGILWSLVQAEPQSLRLASRAKALATFSPEKIVAHYTDLFRKIRQVA